MNSDRSYQSVISTQVLGGRWSILCFVTLGFSALAWVLATSMTTLGDELKDQRRERVRQMSAAEKEHLRRRQERFEKLDEQEKQRLRQLHLQISQHPRCEQLQRTMDRYHSWLKELTPAQRAKLRQLSSQQRIAEIRKFQQEQQQAFIHRQGRNLSSDDIEAITKWASEYAQRQEQRVLQAMSKSERERLSGRSDEMKKRFLFFRVWRGAIFVRPGQVPKPEESPQLTDDDIASFAKVLSVEARKMWDQAQSNSQHAQLATQWVHDAVRARFSSLRRSSYRQVSKQEIEKLFDNLPPEKRDELKSLSPDEMQRALLGMYHRNGHRGHQGRPPRRPGDDREPRGPEDRRDSGDRPGEHRGQPRFGPGFRDRGPIQRGPRNSDPRNSDRRHPGPPAERP